MVFDSHMLAMASKNPLSNLFRKYYKTFLTPKLVKNNLPVIRTQDDDYVNKKLGIPTSLTPLITLGSDTLLFKEKTYVKSAFRLKHNIDGDTLVLLYAGKIDEAKGGMLLATLLEERFCKRDLVLVLVGNLNGEYGKKS